VRAQRLWDCWREHHEETRRVAEKNGELARGGEDCGERFPREEVKQFSNALKRGG
jgi:hypothetical protein